MKTSYFDKYSGTNTVSIAGQCPSWYTGRQYKKIAPKYVWWKKWHDGEYTDEQYTQLYYETVLTKLDAQEVYDEIGEDSVVLCHEPGELTPTGKYIFCHRHIVSAWFKKELGIDVPEL